MSTTLTPSSGATIPASLTAPADGDACSAASNNGPDQALLDAVTALRHAAYGVNQRPAMYSLDGTSVVVASVPAMVVTDAGAWTARSAIGGATFTVAHLEGGGSFSADAWYYLYYYIVAGAVTRAISTTGPDPSRKFKSGPLTTHMYLGAIRTDGAAGIRPFHAQRGSYLYTDGVAPAGASLSGSGTDVALAAALPPSARVAHLRLFGYSSSSSVTPTLSFYPKGFVGSGDFVSLPAKMTNAATAADEVELAHRFSVATDSSQNITFAATGTGYVATLNVIGYEEE